MTHQLRAVAVGGMPAAWEQAGFVVDDGRVVVGSTVLRIDPAQDGIGQLAIDHVYGDIDGLPTTAAASPAPQPGAPEHPNRIRAIDHLVVLTGDCDRTTAAFAGVGIEARRVRRFPVGDTVRRQTFFWLGDVILELVGEEADGDRAPATAWGLAFTSDDLDATVAVLGALVSEPRRAVQHGRRIATLRVPGIEVPISILSPHVTIRTATASDVAVLVALEVAAGERFRAIGLAEIADDPVCAGDFDEPLRAGHLWVAERNEGIVGYIQASIVDGGYHLEQVSVSPDASGYGIGRMLEQHLGDVARRAGCRSITLTTFVDVAFNGPLYERWGYRHLRAGEVGSELAAIRAAEDARWFHLPGRSAMGRDIDERG